MGAYKRDVVIVIKMGAYIHGCLFCVGAYDICLSLKHVWQSRIEIEYYSVLYVLRKWRLKFMYDYPVVLLTLALVVVLVFC